MRAIGLMSGTSLDGIDAAVLETDGRDINAFGPIRATRYRADERALIRRAFGTRGPAPEAAALVDWAHVAAVRALGASAEVIGYHGQTVHHDPEAGVTVQLGAGPVLAASLGTTVVWDFRSADMAAGGQGAPLAPFFHHACARWAGLRAPVAFLNVGGVANVTFVDPRIEAPEAEGALIACDTGPGNALIDDLMAARIGAAMDEDGAAAASGAVDRAALARLMDHDYFAAPAPKSLDRDAFATSAEVVADLSTADAAATLTAFTAEAAARAALLAPERPARWLVCGGGRRNPTLMAMLARRLNAEVAPVEDAGLDGDMLEAQAFAYLAVRSLEGLPLSAPGTTGCRAPVTGGRVARP